MYLEFLYKYCQWMSSFRDTVQLLPGFRNGLFGVAFWFCFA